MIVAGFFQQVFDRITIESVREALGHAIGRRIRQNLIESSSFFIRKAGTKEKGSRGVFASCGEPIYYFS